MSFLFEEIRKEMELNPCMEVLECISVIKSIELFFPSLSGNVYNIQYNPRNKIVHISKNGKTIYKKSNVSQEDFEEMLMDELYPEIYDKYSFSKVKEGNSTFWSRKCIYYFSKKKFFNENQAFV